MTKRYLNGVLVDLTAEEETEFETRNTEWAADSANRAMSNLRYARTEKLKETDFYGNSDVTMSSDMTAYRQALRDLPSNYTTSDSSALAEDLSNLDWPTKP
tara:strand:+ start:1078 stop:1380 length:303 start_codon:yes stop_codon:yes gene_type:complete